MLVVTTLPHYLSALPLLPDYYYVTYEYVNTILIASTLSVLYHLFNESFIVAIPDYIAAFIWLLYDLHFGYYFVPESFKTIIVLNSLVLVSNWCITKSNPHYEAFHSIWHLLSAAKCYYVSLLVSRFKGTIKAHVDESDS